MNILEYLKLDRLDSKSWFGCLSWQWEYTDKQGEEAKMIHVVTDEKS